MNRYLLYFICLLVTFSSCKKSNDAGESNPPPGDTSGIKVSYGDSVLYVKDGDDDNVVVPEGNLKGK
ncbi:MAG: hypothetical protein JNK79_01790, partial [Chitinophagaceae bacterium]|nr:hypothetical protein [Chitinophagaceae bacterium]